MIGGGTWVVEGVGAEAVGEAGGDDGVGEAGGVDGVGAGEADGVGEGGRARGSWRGDWRSGSAVSGTEGRWGRECGGPFWRLGFRWMDGLVFVFFGVGIDVGWTGV